MLVCFKSIGCIIYPKDICINLHTERIKYINATLTLTMTFKLVFKLPLKIPISDFFSFLCQFFIDNLASVFNLFYTARYSIDLNVKQP